MHIAYLNQQYIDQRDLTLSVYDTGFMMGATIAEQIRTFGGRPFRVDQHLRRMAAGLNAAGWLDRIPLADFPVIIDRVVAHNYPQIGEGQDLGVTVFVTPGLYPTFAPNGETRPTVAIHTYPLPFQLWASCYQNGQALQIVDVQQISPKSWSPEIKCRSRMHYYLADREARRRNPDSVALLLDENGHVSETPIANIVVHFPDEGLVSPARSRILPGISLEFLQNLASQRQVPMEFRDIDPGELSSAREILLTSTPYCLMPITAVSGQPVGDGSPGPLFQRFIRDWSAQVDCDIVQQAHRCALGGHRSRPDA